LGEHPLSVQTNSHPAGQVGAIAPETKTLPVNSNTLRPAKPTAWAIAAKTAD